VDDLKAQVIDIIRGATHDGPGVRTTIFLKGCPLACAWCQNPEGMSARPEVWWAARTCIRCGACLAACPALAISDNGDGLQRDRSICKRCGACVEACPSRAMSFTSREWTLDALVKEALKDRDYYQSFGGGVTVSGGEPLGQSLFVSAFFKRLHESGVRTALDTCGLAPAAALAAVLPHTDHVLFDIKLLDPVLHKDYTGQSNGTILANLLSVADHIRHVNPAMKLWIRTPLIPGATATTDNITAIGRYIHHHLLDVMERWELCAFNSACRTKYERMGLPWAYAETPFLNQREADALKQAALSTGLTAGQVMVSGLVAKA
jgi:pyruvate formate lyase activating enzyme